MPAILEGAGPCVLVRHAIKVTVSAQAASDPDARRTGGGKATDIICIDVWIVYPGYHAISKRIDLITVLKVANFVRESDIVRMSRPRHPRMLA